MIKFHTIRYKNLLSTGDKFTEIYLDRHQNTLILGENGAGKSTLLDALCFSLYGKGFRNLKKELLINSINGKGMVVEIEFSIGLKSYKVIRGMKPNKFEIYIDGELVAQDASVRDYQEYLEKNILKTSYRSFTQVAILGSANFVPFMQLKAKDRRELVEDLLDISIFSTMQTILRQRLTNHANDVNENRHGIELLEERIHGLHNQLKALKENRDQKIERYKKTIEDTEKHIQDLQNKKTEPESNILSIQKYLEQDKISKEVYEVSKLDFAKLHEERKSLSKELVFFQDTKECPTCNQTISEKSKKKQIETLGDKIIDTTTEIKKLEKQISKLETKLQKLKDSETELAEQQRKLNELESEVNTNNKYKVKILAEISELEKDLKQNDDVQDKIDDAEDILDRLHKKKEALVKHGHYLDIAKLLLKDQGVKEKIVKQYVPVMNKLINKYLAQLEFYVGFELNELFEETIKSRFRDVFKYDNFSQGEKMRIDLALLFTWRSIARMKNSMSTNLLILDEVFDSSLDVSGTEDFLKLLGSLETETNAFIISHKGDMLYDRFENVLKFEKHKNFSRIAD